MPTSEEKTLFSFQGKKYFLGRGLFDVRSDIEVQDTVIMPFEG